MKKVLSILGLIAIIGTTTPVLAAPGGPGGPHGGHGRHHGGHQIHAGMHHRPHMAPRHHGHGGVVIHTGYPRHSYWGGYRSGYWGSNWCNYRLGCCDPYYYSTPYIAVPGASFSIRF